MFGEEINKDLLSNQIRSYQDSLKYYRDLKNSLDTARDEGVEKVIEIDIEKVTINALKMGKSISEIIELNGLTEAQIRSLK